MLHRYGECLLAIEGRYREANAEFSERTPAAMAFMGTAIEDDMPLLAA
jgi:hypothetical protein